MLQAYQSKFVSKSNDSVVKTASIAGVASNQFTASPHFLRAQLPRRADGSADCNIGRARFPSTDGTS